MKVLYHYTCEHGRKDIGEKGWLKPSTVTGYLWLTDLDTPVREALGLTSHILDCDRTQYRYRVYVATPSDQVVPWHILRKELMHGTYGRIFVDSLEQAPGAMPMHWWVAVRPIWGELS